VEIEPLLAEEARKRQVVAGQMFGEAHPKQEVVPILAQPASAGKARDQAGKATKIGKTYVSEARKRMLAGKKIDPVPKLAQGLEAGKAHPR